MYSRSSRALVEDDVQQAERERGVGAGQRREVLVGLLGGAGAQRVDRHHVRAGRSGVLR